MDFKGLQLSDMDCLFLLYSVAFTLCNTSDDVIRDELLRCYLKLVVYSNTFLGGEQNG